MNVAGSARAVIIVLTQMAPINARVCVVSVCRVTDVPARWPQVRHSQAQSNNISLQHLLVEIRGAGPCRGGRPHASWLRQVKSYLKDTGMAGLASAWAMARRRPEYRRKVDPATRCSGVCAPYLT